MAIIRFQDSCWYKSVTCAASGPVVTDLAAEHMSVAAQQALHLTLGPTTFVWARIQAPDDQAQFWQFWAYAENFATPNDRTACNFVQFWTLAPADDAGLRCTLFYFSPFLYICQQQFCNLKFCRAFAYEINKKWCHSNVSFALTHTYLQ